MVDYYRVILGSASKYAEQAHKEGWVGTGWLGDVDLTDKLPDQNADFRAEFIDQVIRADGVGSRIAAGLACSATWTLAKQMSVGDIVLSPTGKGQYLVGRITGPYFFKAGEPLAHRRPVEWLSKTIQREQLSPELKGALSAMLTVTYLKGYPEDIQAAFEGELSKLIAGTGPEENNEEYSSNSVTFLMEQQLESFLVDNWSKTSIGKDFEILGTQVPTKTGPLDILAQSKDGKTLLVVELKLRRASDDAIGQILRYMAWVKSEAENDKTVKGLIVATEKTPKLEWALKMTPDVDFMRYEVNFRLFED